MVELKGLLALTCCTAVRLRFRPCIASYASNVVLPTRLQWDSHETGGKDDRYDLEIVHQHGQLKTVSCKSSMVEVNLCDLGFISFLSPMTATVFRSMS